MFLKKKIRVCSINRILFLFTLAVVLALLTPNMGSASTFELEKPKKQKGNDAIHINLPCGEHDGVQGKIFIRPGQYGDGQYDYPGYSGLNSSVNPTNAIIETKSRNIYTLLYRYFLGNGLFISH